MSDKPIRCPSSPPTAYSTLAGLLAATERVLRLRPDRVAGMSKGMWLHNAEFVARENFGDAASIPTMRENLSVTRPQDLKGGHSLFGFPLPKRVYEVGDVVPGVGKIAEKIATPGGVQFLIAGQWYNERCFESAA